MAAGSLRRGAYERLAAMLRVCLAQREFALGMSETRLPTRRSWRCGMDVGSAPLAVVLSGVPMIQHVRDEFLAPVRQQGVCLARYDGCSGLRYGLCLR